MVTTYERSKRARRCSRRSGVTKLTRCLFLLSSYPLRRIQFGVLNRCCMFRLSGSLRPLTRSLIVVQPFNCQARQVSLRIPIKIQQTHQKKNTQPGMDFNDGPLVWIDCEMTGLDYRKDKIIEIAVRPHDCLTV